MKIFNSQRGFTIPELLVGMTIVGILSTIGFISYTYNLSKARDTVRVSDIKNISKVVKLYQLDTGKVPAPSDSFDVTYSGALVWKQGVFGQQSQAETGKIFGELQDPKFNNQYTYSTTSNSKEFQISAVFESEEKASSFITFRAPEYDFIPATYAADDFSPLELSPKIWLDGKDVDGDGDTTDNPGNGANVASWVNKSSAGSANNPTIAGTGLKYSTTGIQSQYPGVFIANSAGLLLNNSDISQGDIFYVVQRNDPFGSNDKNGYGLYSSSNASYLIGYSGKYYNALRIGSSPRFTNSYPALRGGEGNYPRMYHFSKNGGNYSFRDNAYMIAQGASNSINGHVWAFNQSGSNPSKSSDLVIGEILIFDTPLTRSEREKVEGYLAHKWGQSAYLPWGHPYEYDVPESSGPPPAPDSTPDVFVLNDITDANINTEYVSNSVSITGINTSTNISVSGGEYSINGGSFTNSSGVVSQGDMVRVRHTSGNGDNITTTTSLNVGGISETFTVTTLTTDTTPDDFNFTDITLADLNVLYSTQTIQVNGINTPIPVSISGTGAEYKISNGIPVDVTGEGTASANQSYGGNAASQAFDNNTNNKGWGNNGSLPARLQYDIGYKERINKYTLYRNYNQNGGWYNSDSPKNWTFEGSNDGVSWNVLDSRSNEYIYQNSSKREYSFSNSVAYRYYRINISRAVSGSYVNITEMELLNEGSGNYSTAPGTIHEGETISVRMPSANIPETQKIAQLTLGSIQKDFSITTLGSDTTPDTFSFAGVNEATLSTVYESNTITVSGINSATPISISGGGEYKINAGTFTGATLSVNEGDYVTLRMVSPSSNSQTNSTTLTIGGVSGTYNITTPAPPPDTTPDLFGFFPQQNASLSTNYASNTITISGINTQTPLSITGGAYDKNNSGTYSNATTNVSEGDTIRVRGTSSSAPNTPVTVRLTVGGVSSDFVITTIPQDVTPESFSVSNISGAELSTSYISNSFTVTGINTGIPISVSAGEYSINDGGWTSAAGTIYNNDQVRLRNNSSSSWASTSSMDVTIGAISQTFAITTGQGDTTPDVFVFTDVNNAILNSQYISNSILVSGINATTSISVVGGEYAKGESNQFTSQPGTVEDGDIIRLKLVSSIDGETTKSVTVNIGGVTDSYDVTTKPYDEELSDTPTLPSSNVLVAGNYNGLIVHAHTGSLHYVLAAPSIITYDKDDHNFSSIVENNKFVYKGYENIPASYVKSGLTMSGGFNFNIPSPLFYEGTKEDLGSYTGLKQIDEGIRSSYSNFTGYQHVASSLDDYSLGYLERIIGESIGINPIKPYYCSDILRSKLIYNIAPKATITASPSGYNGYGVEGIANGVKSTQGDLDYEYHSAEGNAFINFEWEELQRVGYIRIYNRTGCCSNRLSNAVIKLFNQDGGLIYSHALWDTTNDFVIDLDLVGIGHMHYVKKVAIESVGGNFLNLREVEIFLGGNVVDGEYKVDKDGLGGQSPYNVYCDMTTDGGGWTRIGDNYITNGTFSEGNHIAEHDFTGFDNPGDNVIVSPLTQTPPSALPGANVLRHNGDSSEYYNLHFNKIPGEYFAQEIRLRAWVKGSNESVFSNMIRYADGSTSTTIPEYDILQTVDGWKYVMARIPLSGLVQSFDWKVGENVAGPFYITGLDMEVYYK